MSFLPLHSTVWYSAAARAEPAIPPTRLVAAFVSPRVTPLLHCLPARAPGVVARARTAKIRILACILRLPVAAMHHSSSTPAADSSWL